MTCTNLSPLGPFLGTRSQRVAGGDAASGSLGSLNGAGLSSVSLCQQKPGGRDPAPPPAAPGTAWEERAGNPWPQGAPGAWQPCGRRKPYPPQVPAPCTLCPALIRPWLHTNPPLVPKGGTPEPWLWGRGRCWPGAGLGACGAVLPEVLPARPRCRHLLAPEKVPVPFIFLYGDVMRCPCAGL